MSSCLQVDGVKSSHPVHGWGPKGGFVWQKPYVEFFCSAETFKDLVPKLKKCETMSWMATTRRGDMWTDCGTTTCVTWGAMALQEIVQPFVVSPEAFLAWKDEAFELWSSMLGAVAEDAGKQKIAEIQDNWLLVSVLDNNFKSGDVFRMLHH